MPSRERLAERDRFAGVRRTEGIHGGFLGRMKNSRIRCVNGDSQAFFVSSLPSRFRN
jgi:hypothetical protein